MGKERGDRGTGSPKERRREGGAGRAKKWLSGGKGGKSGGVPGAGAGELGAQEKEEEKESGRGRAGRGVRVGEGEGAGERGRERRGKVGGREGGDERET